MTEPYVGRWWQDANLLQQAVADHGTQVAAAIAIGGVTHQTLAAWWRKFGLPPLPTGHPPKKRPAQAPTDEWLLDALKQAGDRATVEDLANIADRSPLRVREAAERLVSQGYRVNLGLEDGQPKVRLERTPTVTGDTHKLDASLFDGDVFRFGVTSDEHTSSDAESLDAWEAAYDVFQAEGITTVFSPGDLVDGMGIYRGQVSEVLNHTYEAQVDHAVASHPQRDGITTYRISGNHDLEGDFGRVGADPVQAVCNRRDDVKYLGRYSAWVDLPNGARMHILHPMGGGSYATSYRVQKQIESYQLGDKPNILLIGHYHKQGYFFSRGVHGLLCGTFQGPTTYSIRKALGEPGFGFHIVTCRLAKDGSVVRFQPEFYPFFNGRIVA